MPPTSTPAAGGKKRCRAILQEKTDVGAECFSVKKRPSQFVALHLNKVGVHVADLDAAIAW